MKIKTKNESCILNFETLDKAINMFKFIAMCEELSGDKLCLFHELIDDSLYTKTTSVNIESIFDTIDGIMIKEKILTYLN